MSAETRARRARWQLIAAAAGIGTVVVAVLVALLSTGGGGKPSGQGGHGSAAPAPTSSAGEMTPTKGQPVRLSTPKKQENGVSVGFPHKADGALSAAVYYLEDLSLLDDKQVQRQMETISSTSSPASVEKRVSEVRNLREQVGLPPSGGTPAGFNVTTSVNAVRARTLAKNGDVVQVWMDYDLYAQLPDGGPDDEPLKGESTSMILAWEDGDWKVTDNEAYTKNGDHPVAYDPDSPYAWQDGWWQVRRAD